MFQSNLKINWTSRKSISANVQQYTDRSHVSIPLWDTAEAKVQVSSAGYLQLSQGPSFKVDQNSFPCFTYWQGFCPDFFHSGSFSFFLSQSSSNKVLCVMNSESDCARNLMDFYSVQPCLYRANCVPVSVCNPKPSTDNNHDDDDDDL